MACSMVLTAISFFTALLAELAGAALGFGPAILYEISWQLCTVFGLTTGALESAVFHIVLQEAPCGLIQLVLLRRFWRPRLWALLNMPVLVTLPLGTVLLEHFGRTALAKPLLGIVFLGLAFLQLYKERVHQRQRDGVSSKLDMEERTFLVSLGVVTAAAAAGLLRGALGLAGPPFMMLLLYFSVDRGVWRCLANTVRVTMMLSQGVLLGLDDGQLHAENWPIYVSLMFGGIVGLLVGNRLAEKVDAAAFQRWLLLFLLAGACLMLSSVNAVLSTGAAFLVFLAAVLVLVVPSLTSRRVSQLGLVTAEELCPASQAELENINEHIRV